MEVNNLQLAETIVQQHDSKHDFVFDGKTYKLRIMMEDGAVEVRLFDLSSDITNEQIAEFLSEYGDVLNVRDLLWDERSAFGGVKTGVRIARMIVKKNIPSLVAIRGEDTAVSYKGQRQTCMHCQEFVHVGIPCVQNKKLLAQKLEADRSYANVTKQPSLQKSAKPNNIPPKVPQPQVQQNPSRQAIAKPNETQPTMTQQTNTMPPPAVMDKRIGVQPILQITPLPITIGSFIAQKSDGNETDISQASLGSSSSRRLRSKRSPPGKKMRRNDSNEHGRGSGDDMQQ